VQDKVKYVSEAKTSAESHNFMVKSNGLIPL
jgi:hypothetical protein